MDQKKLQQKNKEFLEIIAKRGVGALFENYDPNDDEGNYLKRKILSQLHYHDRSYLTDEEFEKYVQCEEGRREYIPSKVHYDAMKNLQSMPEEMYKPVSEYLAIEKLLTRYADKVLERVKEKIEKLQQSTNGASLREKLQKRKAIKELEKEIKQYNKLFADYKERKEQIEPHVLEFKSNYPVEYACIEAISENNEESFVSNTMQGVLNGKDVSFFYVEDYVGNHMHYEGCPAFDGPLEWCERSDNVAISVLTTMTLDKGLTFDEFIQASRTGFESKEDKVSLDYRDCLLVDSDVFCGVLASPNEIPKLMKGLKAKFDEANFDEMSTEEIIRFAARICWEFIKIHPYTNGNGRTSRMMIDYILMSNGIESPVLFTGAQSKIKFQTSMDFKSKKLSSAAFEEYVLNCYNQQFGKDLDNNLDLTI